MYLFNSTEWCYIKRTTDNVLQILLQASRWRVKTANTILQIPWKKLNLMQIHLHEAKILQIHNARPEFIKNITAIKYDCYIKRTTDNVLLILLQASRWRVKTANTILQIPWKKVKSYANTPTWSKSSANSQCKAWICKKISRLLNSQNPAFLYKV